MTKEDNITLKQAISIAISIVIGLILAQVISLCYTHLESPTWIIISLLVSLILIGILFFVILDISDLQKGKLEMSFLGLFLCFLLNLPYVIIRLFVKKIETFAGVVIDDTWNLNNVFIYLIITSISFIIYAATLNGLKKTIFITTGILVVIGSLMGAILTW